MTDMRIHSVQELYDKGFREFRVVHSGEAEAMQEEIAALETSLAERWENLNVQDGVIDGLREEIAALKSAPLFDALANKQEARIAALEKVAVRLYNLGYHSGHEDTVEGCYTHIYEADMDEYHDDVVDDILREAGYLKEEG